MFRTVRLSIIRSLFTAHSAMVYVIQVCRQLSNMLESWFLLHRFEMYVSGLGIVHIRLIRLVPLIGWDRRNSWLLAILREDITRYLFCYCESWKYYIYIYILYKYYIHNSKYYGKMYEGPEGEQMYSSALSLNSVLEEVFWSGAKIRSLDC